MEKDELWYMSDDALWIIDLLQMQIATLRVELENKTIRRERFERFSYGSWAISETLLAVCDYKGYVDTDIIREILQIQLEDYNTYYNRNTEIHANYKYAYEMIRYIIDLTEGF